MSKPKMKKYGVTLPLCGSVWVEVEAENEEAAIDAALEADVSKSDPEWETMRHIVKGNVFYGNCREADAQEIEP